MTYSLNTTSNAISLSGTSYITGRMLYDPVRMEYRFSEEGNMGEGTRGGHDYKGRITTRAQRIKAGWVGQILVDGTIVFEGKPQNDTGEGDEKKLGSQLALDEANAKLVEGFTKLFS